MLNPHSINSKLLFKVSSSKCRIQWVLLQEISNRFGKWCTKRSRYMLKYFNDKFNYNLKLLPEIFLLWTSTIIQYFWRKRFTQIYVGCRPQIHYRQSIMNTVLQLYTSVIRQYVRMLWSENTLSDCCRFIWEFIFGLTPQHVRIWLSYEHKKETRIIFE